MGWKEVREGEGRTAVAGVGVSDERGRGVEVRDHFGVGAHIVEVGDAEVGVAEEGGGGAGAGLCWLSVRG